MTPVARQPTKTALETRQLPLHSRGVPSSECITRVEDLDPYLDAWDAMAVEAARPLASPKWLMPWIRHAAPQNAQVRTVVVRDGDGLIGLAPFFAQEGSLGRVDIRLFGVPFSERREPLSKPGREDEVAAEVARLLATTEPRPSIVALEGIEESSSWPDLLKRHYPGPIRPLVARRMVLQTPTLTFNGETFDEWMQSKSSNFRSQMRRMRRQLTEEGGQVRVTGSDDDIEKDVDSFMSLHLGRWEGRGGSGLADRGMHDMLVDAANELLTEERFRLYLVELGEKPIGAGLFVAGGGELTYFNGGFDEDYGAYKPVLQTILSAVEDSLGRGEKRLDFGGGAQPYKLRFANQTDPVTWVNLRPRNARYPITRAQLLKEDLRWYGLNAFRRLPDERREQLKKLLRR
jgi:CelD/BcsL family acetyltransferase involved in cellulose biosynthesis